MLDMVIKSGYNESYDKEMFYVSFGILRLGLFSLDILLITRKSLSHWKAYNWQWFKPYTCLLFIKIIKSISIAINNSSSFYYSFFPTNYRCCNTAVLTFPFPNYIVHVYQIYKAINLNDTFLLCWFPYFVNHVF